MQSSFKASLFGASPSTGNQGVNALCWSTLAGLAQRGCNDLHVFDYGRKSVAALHGTHKYTLHGMTVGKRFWHPGHLGASRLAAAAGSRKFGLLNVVDESDLVLDVSGGDSFTDLYGTSRFRQIIAPKEIALRLNRPLVLLPQTFGPFAGAASRRTARRLIDGAALAYARDTESYARLKTLLADRFDPARHRLGVDLAFGLPAQEPGTIEPGIAHALAEKNAPQLVGLNISGLVANQPGKAARKFGLTCDYPALIRELLIRFLDETDVRLLIVPHVHAPEGHFESDLDASISLLAGLPSRYQSAVAERVSVAAKPMDACELKWLIRQCDWFCGTRMHATIAAISSGVPTAALAYSLKTRGVFRSCGVEQSVVDLRQPGTTDVVQQVMNLWHQREEDRSMLSRYLPRVHAVAARQLDEIAACGRQHWAEEGAVRC